MSAAASARPDADERDGVRTVTSVARAGNTRTDSAHNRYNIDPKELIRIQREGRERGEDIIGFYHSHPDHPAQWSQTDLAEAHWFGCSYVITSVEKGKAVLTNSFELTGSNEDDKKLVAEKIEVGDSCVGRTPSPAAFDLFLEWLQFRWRGSVYPL